MNTFLCAFNYSNKHTVDYHSNSRALMALFALGLQLYFSISLPRTFLFSLITALNIPSIIALAMCLFPQTSSIQFQKLTKNFLKFGIAKAVGGVLLALYICIKYFGIYNANNSYTGRVFLLNSAWNVVICALIDIVYSFVAISAIKRTKSIIKILKKQPNY